MITITPGRVYTLLFYAIGGVMFSFFLPVVYRLQGTNATSAVRALWLNNNTNLLIEHSARLYGHALLGGALVLLTNYLPLGLVLCDVLSALSWLQRYRYGLLQGMPHEITNGAYFNVALFGLEFAVNFVACLLRLFRVRRFDSYANKFNAALLLGFGLLHFLYHPVIESKELPRHGISWYLQEGQNVVTFNFQLLSAVTIVMGLLAMLHNKRHPLPYAIGFALMAVVEWFKWNAFKAPVYSNWESPDVSLAYFAACVVGALLNLYDTLFVPSTNRKERNPSLRTVVQSVASTAKEALHSAESAVSSLKDKEEMHGEWNEGEGIGGGSSAKKGRLGKVGAAKGMSRDSGMQEEEPARGEWDQQHQQQQNIGGNAKNKAGAKGQQGKSREPVMLEEESMHRRTPVTDVDGAEYRKH